MKRLTIRHGSTELVKRLEARARSEGKSVNALVLGLLNEAAGLGDRREALKRYTTWTDGDLREFTTHLKAQRTVDATRWK